MGKALWESNGNGNWLQNWEWEWEGMGIDCTGMGGSGNVKAIPGHIYYTAVLIPPLVLHLAVSLVPICNCSSSIPDAFVRVIIIIIINTGKPRTGA